jgi:hypothetical protein
MEEWKSIPGFETYEASTLGNIRNKDGHLMSVIETEKGYYKVNLRDFDNNSKKLQRLVSRLVAITFIPNPENKPEVDHIDRNPKNNTVKNLRWVTRTEQMLNTNDRTEHRNIYEIPRKKCYMVQIKRYGEVVKREYLETLEDAIICRDEFLTNFH